LIANTESWRSSSGSRQGTARQLAMAGGAKAASSARPPKLESTDLVYGVCTIHLLVCVALIATMTPGAALHIGHAVLSPMLQWVNAAFCCLSIISIVAAGVGTLYLIEGHLGIYWYVLLISAFADGGWILMLALHGESCKVLIKDAEIEKSSKICTFTVATPVVGLAVLIVFKLLGMIVVSKAKKTIRIRYTDDLLPHMKQSLQDSFGNAGDDLFGWGPSAEEEEAIYQQSLAVPEASGTGGALGYGAAQLRSQPPSRMMSSPAMAVPPSSFLASGTPMLRSAPAQFQG